MNSNLKSETDNNDSLNSKDPKGVLNEEPSRNVDGSIMTASIGSSKGSKKKSKKSSREPKIRVDEGLELPSDSIDDFEIEKKSKSKKSKKSKKASKDRSDGFGDAASSLLMNSMDGSKDSKKNKKSSSKGGKMGRVRGPSKAVKEELAST